jgi:hypothetical protein
MQKSLTTLIFLVFLGLQGFSQSFENVRFTGRFDFSGEVPRFSHVSSSISVNFQGSGISATFSASYGVSYLYVILDGNDDPLERKVIVIESSTAQEFILAENLEEGEHRIDVVKLNQYDTKVAFHGFEVVGGDLLEKPIRPGISLEFYGDSNPAGHSAWDAKDWGKTSDNGGHFTYPGIISRLLAAEYHNITMGGAGVTSGTWNLRDYYDLIHMNESASGSNLWNFTAYTPDVVVVNLGANDYYAGMTKAVIKKGWKDFIREDLRVHYPDAHVVLVNAYGWAIKEPADYVHEAIEELKAAGEENVSSVTIPWLWGQEHAVVNEHAGFANILARHIADELDLPEPDSSELSSFAPLGKISNGSFEKSTLPGVADGWRPHGPVQLVTDSLQAFEGGRYLELGDGAWVNFANDAQTGDEYRVTGWLRGLSQGASGALKLEFKDQEQRTINAAEDRRALSGEWEYFSVSLKAPRTVWSVWVVLDNGQNNRVAFDDIRMSLNGDPSAVQLLEVESGIEVYPNPFKGRHFFIRNADRLNGPIFIHDLMGRLVATDQLRGQDLLEFEFQEPLDPGVYVLSIHHAGNPYVYLLLVQ